MRNEGLETTALVTAAHRERYTVRLAEGEAHARVKAAAFYEKGPEAYPTVGDTVALLYNPLGDSQIISVAPRRSLFTRMAPGPVPRAQAVAANFDEVFLISSLNQESNLRRMERYAAQAWQSGGTPVVILTKLDLVKDAARRMAEAERAVPGVPVYAVSAVTGEGVEAVRARLSGEMIIALLGSSGVGKSSLVNALSGREEMAVGEVRTDDDRGRHTTTHRQLITLSMGAHVIDTPGMRELGLWDAEEGLKEAFEDIDTLALACRFSDCAHGAEPGCAVRRAIEEGRLDEKRLRSYRSLLREAARRERHKKKPGKR